MSSVARLTAQLRRERRSAARARRATSQRGLQRTRPSRHVGQAKRATSGHPLPEPRIATRPGVVTNPTLVGPTRSSAARGSGRRRAAVVELIGTDMIDARDGGDAATPDPRRIRHGLVECATAGDERVATRVSDDVTCSCAPREVVYSGVAWPGAAPRQCGLSHAPRVAGGTRTPMPLRAPVLSRPRLPFPPPAACSPSIPPHWRPVIALVGWNRRALELLPVEEGLEGAPSTVCLREVCPCRCRARRVPPAPSAFVASFAYAHPRSAGLLQGKRTSSCPVAGGRRPVLHEDPPVLRLLRGVPG